ncbi:hypothetical protein SmJEL517_g04713 [Synchytrium microbalum]|uniref:Uncharacterized protein n=1 Tax=Synchytrium microbalum TaxID=1806994 RepID=A0A507BSY3_9FUNG|nr:uncharacterized protein SmJEL517_g04713 [Synchytrium microbalum]TPX32157.1 hypothetical protein SmJEL517_g04713 [Synchytrium microbalum]
MTSNSTVFGDTNLGEDLASAYGFTVAPSVVCALFMLVSMVPLFYFLFSTPVHRWTRITLLFYALFQGISYLMRAVCAGSARSSGSIFAAAASLDIIALYLLVMITFNLDRKPKKFGDSRRATLKSVIRLGGSVIITLVMILGAAGAALASGFYMTRADQMMQASAVFMCACMFLVSLLCIYSVFAPRFDGAARVKDIDADLKATLMLVLVSLMLFVVTGYRLGAAFVPAVRAEMYYFTINFLLEFASAVLLALPITAGQGGIDVMEKVESHGLMGRPGVVGDGHSGPSTGSGTPASSINKPVDLTRAHSYNGPVVKPGTNVPVSSPTKAIHLPLSGDSSVAVRKPSNVALASVASLAVPSASNWPEPIDASPVNPDTVIQPAYPPVPISKSPAMSINSGNSAGGRERPPPPRFVGASGGSAGRSTGRGGASSARGGAVQFSSNTRR